MPVGVKQHLMGLKKVSPHEESTAVRQLDMGHLQLGALATQDRAIRTPVELERLAWPENQRHKSPAPLVWLSCCRSARQSRANAATRR